MIEIKNNLPGEDLIKEGLQDLSKGVSSLASLLVLIGAPRLRELGLKIPPLRDSTECPEHALYDFLRNENAKTAHSRYNALIRRLVSFERAMESISRI